MNYNDEINHPSINVDDKELHLQLERLQDEILETERINKRLKQQVNEAKNYYEFVTHSTTWRVGAPIRALLSGVKRIIRLGR